MGVVVWNMLKTKEPEDLKRAADYIIEQTRVQSLKDTGSEWPLNQDVGWGDQGLIIDEEGALWQDSSYYAKHLNIDELATNIARQFSDMEFTLDIWADNDPIGCSYLWDGNQWVENEEPEDMDYIDEQLDNVSDIAPENCTTKQNKKLIMDKEQYFLEFIHEGDGEELSKLGLNVLENPEQCVKVLLEQMRSGNDEFKFVLIQLLFHGYGLHLLQAEDKQWLLDDDWVECKAIVLIGMYKSWHTWEEPFTDEDTGETVVITRNEILSTPLFASTEDEAKVLFEQICQQSTPVDSEELVHCVRWHTSFDYTLIIRNEYEELLERCRKGEGFYDMKTIHQWGHYGWLCEQLGDLYFYGEEEFGYFIDKEKARYFYAETQKAKDYHHDESLLANGNPMDGYDETQA